MSGAGAPAAPKRGIYARHVFPRVMNVLMDTKETRRIRAEVCAGLAIDLPDDAADAALSTWTLCSIPDPVAAVREIARVLRPGGALHFVEHGLSPDEGVQKWQHRCNGIQNRIACGCNIQRDIPAILAAGGMTVLDLETFYAKGDPKILGWTSRGAPPAADAQLRPRIRSTAISMTARSSRCLGSR